VIAPNNKDLKRVLIASSHPLFAKGLENLFRDQWGEDVEVVGLVSDLNQAMISLENLKPDLIVVDYDDENINREEFLARFVEGELEVRLVLLSLQQGNEAIVYDRRTLAASRIEDWLDGLSDVNKDLGLAKNAKSPRSNSMRHFIFVAIIVAVLTGLVGFGLESIGLMPLQASLQAESVDDLFHLEVWVIAFLFALIVGFVLYSVVVFRRKPGDTGEGEYITGNNRLEVIWTLIPLGTVLIFSFLGSKSLAETRRADPNALEVKVISSQWSWRFEYTDFGFSSTELVLPVNQQVLLVLTSTDVIHSFWVPEFRLKQDALPGENMERELRITPSEIGEYQVRCAELCGLQHAYMNAPVRVVEPSEFDAWLEDQTAEPSGDAAERGEEVAQQFGCLSCHSADGSQGVGPTWLGVFGSEKNLTNGTTVTVNEEYLRQSILVHQEFARVKKI